MLIIISFYLSCNTRKYTHGHGNQRNIGTDHASPPQTKDRFFVWVRLITHKCSKFNAIFYIVNAGTVLQTSEGLTDSNC